MHIFHYIRMPEPLSVLGLFYSIFVIFSLITYLKEGYWVGMTTGIINLIKTRFVVLISLIVLVLFIIMFLDKSITNFCKEIYNVNAYTSIDFISSMAEGWFVFGVFSMAILLYSYFAKDRTSIALKIGLMSSVYASLANSLIKLIFNRQRPSIGTNPWAFFQYFMTMNKDGHNYGHLFYAYSSMASGHTVTIVAAITPLVLYTKHNFYKFILISFAIIAAISRVYTINHWLSDVCVATILGIIIGRICYANNKYRLAQGAIAYPLEASKSTPISLKL